MRTFEITEKEVAAAFREAESGEAKKILAALFCKEEMVKPTLDDYKTIRTYEDACKALGEPIFEDPNNLPNHIIALMKLETISRALWGRNFQPKPDGEGSKVYWYPWFALWTKKEVEDMNPEQRGALCLRMRILVRLRVSVVCLRFIVPRLRLRPLGSACAVFDGLQNSVNGATKMALD